MPNSVLTPEHRGFSARSGADPAAPSLLAPWRRDDTCLDWDLYLRYSTTAQLLDQMLGALHPPVRILEVGCNIHHLLPRFLDPQLVHVTRCDVLPFDEPDYIMVPREGPLPMADESFDAVVALEVLEHMPAERRAAFLADCLRVARHGAIFSCPNGVPEVVEAETLAATAYQHRVGVPHPFFLEHREFGLPREDEILAILRDLDCPHTVLDNAPLDVWLAMLLLAETLNERHPLPALQQQFHRPFFLRSTGCRIPYRKIFVCARTFDATRALEPMPATTFPTGHGPDLPAAVASLQHMASAACEALWSQAVDHAGDQAALRAALETQQALEAQLAGLNRELRDCQQRNVVASSFLQSLSQSKLWKLLRPIRELGRLVRLCGFDQQALLACQQLECDPPATPGAWRATGPEPRFLVPCSLPSGWLRVRLKMTSAVPGTARLFADRGDGSFNDEGLLVQAEVSGAVDREFIVSLPRPALAFRFDPLDSPGRFHLETLQVTSLSWAQALLKRASGDTHRLTGSDECRSQATVFHPVTCQPSPGTPRLNIVYVLKTAGICGGVKVVLEHVSRLCARGHNARVYFLSGDTEWFGRPVPGTRFTSLNALRRALAEFRGIKVATWYETAPWVAGSLQADDRGYYLIQDIEQSYCETAEDQDAVLRTYSLGLNALTEGVWVREQVRERFALDSVFLSIGLDFDRFQPRSVARDPNLILTQARTWSGGVAAGRRLKGWETARDAVLRCHHLNPATSLATFSIEGRQKLPSGLPYTHYSAPSDERLAELYGQAGLYLLTSVHEGFGLTAAEAMACGCPVVATEAQGNEEFCIDGYTALTAPVDDVEQLAQKCLLLQSDPLFAAELGQNGYRFIRSYTWERVIDRLEREFLGRDGPEVIIEQARRRTVPACTSDDEYPDLKLDNRAEIDWSLVIPTVNDCHKVIECISTCRQFVPPGCSIEFIVVDDGTRDPGVLRELYQAASDLDFHVLQTHQNLGFSAAVNHGMRHARGRTVVLCNDDIEFFRPWMEALQQAFDDDPQVGIVGAKLLYPDGTIQHAGMDKVQGELRWPHTYARERGGNQAVNHSRYVWSVTGALFAIRRNVLQKLGGLSTAYATAYEDVDYCLHAWANDIRVFYCSDVVAYHREGGTRGADPDEKSARPLVWAERERAGYMYFNRKWAALRHVENFQMLSALLRRGKAGWRHDPAERTDGVLVAHPSMV